MVCQFWGTLSNPHMAGRGHPGIKWKVQNFIDSLEENIGRVQKYIWFANSYICPRNNSVIESVCY